MTILQLKLAVAIAELKSVTAAANMLNISQPNASNSLKLLEDEIGISIFMRTSAGSVLTQKGAEFLEHARIILEENDRILNIRNTDETYRLRLGTANYYTAAEPFYAICNEHRDDTKTDFQYTSVSVAEGIQKLVKRELDIMVAPVLKHQITGLVSECKKNKLELTSICELPAVMTISKNHPMASDSRCLNIVQGCDTMKEYPYIGLKSFSEESGSTAYNDSDFIQCSSKIFVDDANMRLRMIESTNGFSFGVLSLYRKKFYNDLISFPVRDVNLELFCIINRGDMERREIKDYLTLLKKEMAILLSQI